MNPKGTKGRSSGWKIPILRKGRGKKFKEENFPSSLNPERIGEAYQIMNLKYLIPKETWRELKEPQGLRCPGMK